MKLWNWVKRLLGMRKSDNQKQDVQFPPKLSKLEFVGYKLIIPIICWVFPGIYLICIIIDPSAGVFLSEKIMHFTKTEGHGIIYVAFGFVLAGIILFRYGLHKLVEHKARLVDHSDVKALFVEARTVEPRLKLADTTGKEEIRPIDFERKRHELNEEVKRLTGEVGEKGWTEYQILSLRQMLIDFYKIDDLIASSRSTLADLEEYAEDSAFYLDRAQYDRWEKRIEDAISELENKKKECEDKQCNNDTEESKRKNLLQIDDCAEKLRAEMRALVEYVAFYERSWSEGSALIRALTIIGVLSLPILLAMALFPFLCPFIEDSLCVYHWAILGIVGSLSAVLLSFRKSNLVEVGNTEGRRELRRTILGAGLGLTAGVIMYSMIMGDLLRGNLFPDNMTDMEPKDIYRSVFWAITAGFAFERIFDQIRGAANQNE
jgi:hypothetical protein